MSSIIGPTRWRKFETCPRWGAKFQNSGRDSNSWTPRKCGRGGGLWLRLRNLHDAILPFVGVRGSPYQHECLNDIGQKRPLLDEKDARTLAIRFKKAAEVTRHRSEIGSDKNPILERGEGQHFGVGNALQPSIMDRKKIDCWFATETPGDDRTVEAGIRQEANHLSASAGTDLLPHTRKRLLDIGRRWMGSRESILLALAFRNVRFHLFLTSKGEGDCTINLLKTQCRIM
jgi:hypothetical protein